MAFESLDVWQRSARLSAAIYRELANLRDYGFRDQITRAGLSIPSNIAEGLERISNKEKKQFLSYAKGSCGELRTQIYIGMKIAYIPNEKGNQWINDTKDISAMLAMLIKSINA